MGWAKVVGKVRTFRYRRLLVTVLVLLVGAVYFTQVQAVDLLNRFVELGDARSGVTTTYQFGFDIQGPETVGSIKLQFCSNSPLFAQPCTAPSGFSLLGATLASQAGQTGFSIDPVHTTANVLLLTRAPAAAGPGSSTYTLNTVINPTAVGSFYGRLQTFASTDGSGVENDHGGLAMSITSTIQISATVPPFLLFCEGLTISGFDCSTASGDYINFGDLVSGVTSSAESQMVTATNAANGYTLQVNGRTMTSGNNTIQPMAVRDVSRPFVSQFGMNMVANTTPSVGADPQGPGTATPTANYNQANFFTFLSGDTIASASVPQDFRKLTASYILNIPIGQPVGVYVTTLTYVCTGNF